MKKEALLLLLFLLIPTSYAQWYLNAAEIHLQMNIGSGFDITTQGSTPQLSFVMVNQSYYPRNMYRQVIHSQKTTPPSTFGDTIIYQWDDPAFTSYDFELISEITTQNALIPVKTKVPFPLSDLPDSVKPYTRPSETIDSDDQEIILLANTLAEGEDDLYFVVNRLATWTKDNIQYNLSTLTAEATEPASWVLANRRGVCDELTNLFIAMCRSLGIPARFVSGISYTESPLFPERWGFHGWAEVYFPETGWIEYDVTYGEYGYVDPTHIQLHVSADASDPAINYNWLGRDINVQIKELYVDTELISYEGEVDHGIRLDLDIEKPITGFPSANLITATIKNLNPYYVSEELNLYSTPEVSIKDNTKYVALKPFSEKKIHWIIELDDLNPSYTYQIPVTVLSSRNQSTKRFFQSAANEPTYDLSDLTYLIVSDNTKTYSTDVSADCWVETDPFYTIEKNKMNCVLENTGNTFFDSLRVCFKEHCQEISLGISQEKSVSFDLTEEKAGKKEEIVRISSKDLVDSTSITYTVYDTPSILIQNISHPSEVSYNDEFLFSFLNKKDSFSTPKNIIVALNQNGLEKTWDLNELTQDRLYQITMRGSDLRSGHNDIHIRVSYEDDRGNVYSEETSTTLHLTNLSFFERVIVESKGLLSHVLTIPGIAILTVLLILIVVFGGMRKEKY